MSAERDPLVLFMPSGKRGHFPVGTPVLEAARQLGVYVESVCGGRATCGRCQVTVQEGNFAKHKIVSSNDHISERGPKELRYAKVREIAPDRRLSCSATILGDLVIDVPQDTIVNAAVVRKKASGRVIERDSGRAPLLCRGGRTGHAQAAGRSRPAEGVSCARLGQADRLRQAGDRFPPDPRRAEDPAQGKLGRDGGHPPRRQLGRRPHRGAVAGPAQRSLWHCLRYRLDHHRHASGLAAVGPHPRLGRCAEPADPLRRRPDEPRLLRDDEPGRPPRHDRCRARGGERPHRPGLRGRRRDPRGHPRPRLRRQSGHAPPLPRHRPDGTGRRTFRACRFRRNAAVGVGNRHQGQCRRAHLYAALHRRPCRRGCRRRNALRRARTGRTR